MSNKIARQISDLRLELFWFCLFIFFQRLFTSILVSAWEPEFNDQSLIIGKGSGLITWNTLQRNSYFQEKLVTISGDSSKVEISSDNLTPAPVIWKQIRKVVKASFVNLTPINMFLRPCLWPMSNMFVPFQREMGLKGHRTTHRVRKFYWILINWI